MGPTLPMKVNVGGYLITPKADMEPIEEQPFDFSRKYNEVLEEPERKTRSDCPAYQDDDMPRVYCTEGTPRLISRASSIGDLSVGDKRRPETIYEQEEVSIASHTATANATPMMWSRGSSPNSLNSFCMTGTNNFDANSVVSEFSRQPSGLISPSDLPDSPGQTMPPSPKECRDRIYSTAAKQPCYDFPYTGPLGSNRVPQDPSFEAHPRKAVGDSKKVQSAEVPLPKQECRQVDVFRNNSCLSEQFTQEDSLRNYRTEDTPANLSAATSFSDLSSICARSEYSKPIPRPRKISKLPPSSKPDQSRNKSMPDLKEVEHDSPGCNTEDDELLRETITKGRPNCKGGSRRNTPKCSLLDIPVRKKDSDSDSDQQEILDELIKLGRPSSRSRSHIRENCNMRADSKLPNRSERFKSARSMENLSPSKVLKKGCTNFRIREQPLRDSDVGGATTTLLRAQSLKGNKSFGFDHVDNESRKVSPTENRDNMYSSIHSKPISKVSPMRSLRSSSTSTMFEKEIDGGEGDDDDEVQEENLSISKPVLLSPLRSAMRQIKHTSVKKTTGIGMEMTEPCGNDSPPLPPKPAHLRSMLKGATDDGVSAIAMGNASSPTPEATVDTSNPGGAAEPERNLDMEQNNNFPLEPAEDCGDITVLKFKFTESNRSYTRRFLASDCFLTVINYLMYKGYPIDRYRIFVSSVLILKKEVTENNFKKTLADLKMVPKKTLTVKQR